MFLELIFRGQSSSPEGGERGEFRLDRKYTVLYTAHIAERRGCWDSGGGIFLRQEGGWGWLRWLVFQGEGGCP